MDPRGPRLVWDAPASRPPRAAALHLRERHARQGYEHPGWRNRLVLGDSRAVLQGWLDEGLAGQVQMAYVDPPYGVRYHGRLERAASGVQAPRAYRDAWKGGVRGWLTHLRERLALVHALLRPEGACFVQISDEHAHLVRCLLDKVFGAANHVRTISYATSTGRTGRFLDGVHDRLLWYARDPGRMTYRELFRPGKDLAGFFYVELEDGRAVRLTKAQLEGREPIPGGKRFRLRDLSSQHPSATRSGPFRFHGKTFTPPPGRQWATSEEGLARLAEAGRLFDYGRQLRFKVYPEDFPVAKFTDVWDDTQMGAFQPEKRYTVQTPAKVVERCLLMTTDPGDLVLDPTCGSGTTPLVAEQWGRRWLAVDTGRASLLHARERLATAEFPWFQLRGAHPAEGFALRTASHVTLRGLAEGEPPGEEVLHDQPLEERGRTRAAGPFEVHAAGGLDAEPATLLALLEQEGLATPHGPMALHKVQAAGGGARSLALVGGAEREVRFAFGPRDRPASLADVTGAREAAGPALAVVVACAFEPEAWPAHGDGVLLAHAALDVALDPLLEAPGDGQAFTVPPRPEVRATREGNEVALELAGLAGFDPRAGAFRPLEGWERHVAAWLLDPDWRGGSLEVREAGFPGRPAPRSRRGEPPALRTAPFPPGPARRAALAVLDHRGDEVVQALDL